MTCRSNKDCAANFSNRGFVSVNENGATCGFCDGKFRRSEVRLIVSRVICFRCSSFRAFSIPWGTFFWYFRSGYVLWVDHGDACFTTLYRAFMRLSLRGLFCLVTEGIKVSETIGTWTNISWEVFVSAGFDLCV